MANPEPRSQVCEILTHGFVVLYDHCASLNINFFFNIFKLLSLISATTCKRCEQCVIRALGPADPNSARDSRKITTRTAG